MRNTVISVVVLSLFAGCEEPLVKETEAPEQKEEAEASATDNTLMTTPATQVKEPETPLTQPTGQSAQTEPEVPLDPGTDNKDVDPDPDDIVRVVSGPGTLGGTVGPQCDCSPTHPGPGAVLIDSVQVSDRVTEVSTLASP